MILSPQVCLPGHVSLHPISLSVPTSPNQTFREAADGKLKGILAVADEPLVSCDFRCSDVSTTVDAALTMVMGDDMLKVVAWYDNEWGYSQRVVDLAELCAANWGR